MKALLPLLFMFWALTAGAGENNIDRLLADGRLTLQSTMIPEDGAVPGQKLALVIEVATDSWFSGGTRIRIPEVPGLVILQTAQFAANSTERRGAATWVVQRWTLDVYPQRAGDFTVGPIPLQIQVGSSAGNVEGEIASPPVSFPVVLPGALEGAESWVTAPYFSVSETFDRELEGLVPGDAFQRTITFEASDTMAMMLPTFEPETLDGLASYPAPPTLDNYNNRGEVRARRSQSISYVVEAPGTYRLPGRDYLWWDTDNGELRLLTLPATEIHVAGFGARAAASDRAPQARKLAALVGGLAMMTLVAWWLLRYRPWSRLAPLAAPARRLWKVLQGLRRPALPERLNPGSSAGE